MDLLAWAQYADDDDDDESSDSFRSSAALFSDFNGTLPRPEYTAIPFENGIPNFWKRPHGASSASLSASFMSLRTLDCTLFGRPENALNASPCHKCRENDLSSQYPKGPASSGSLPGYNCSAPKARRLVASIVLTLLQSLHVRKRCRTQSRHKSTSTRTFTFSFFLLPAWHGFPGTH